MTDTSPYTLGKKYPHPLPRLPYFDALGLRLVVYLMTSIEKAITRMTTGRIQFALMMSRTNPKNRQDNEPGEKVMK
ncbi:hypothetical protein HQ520_04120 [bacterium]|nr:hypothetical protein [bacterium]